MKLIENIQKRPGMYIGSSGANRLLNELITNSIRECSQKTSGYNIQVRINEDKSMTVEDNGTGLPRDLSLFQKKKPFATKEKCGLTFVNALSDQVEVEVFSEGKKYHLNIKNQMETMGFREIGKTKKSGTKITIWPNFKIITPFRDLSFNLNYLTHAVLNPPLKIQFHSKMDFLTSSQLYFKEGVTSYIKQQIRGTRVTTEDVFVISKKYDDILFDLGSYVDLKKQKNNPFGDFISFDSFTNHFDVGYNLQHQDHGVRSGFVCAIQRYVKKNQLKLKSDVYTIAAGILHASAVFVSVRIKGADPFQIRTISNPQGLKIVQTLRTAVQKEYFAWLTKNPQIAEKIFKPYI